MARAVNNRSCSWRPRLSLPMIPEVEVVQELRGGEFLAAVAEVKPPPVSPELGINMDQPSKMCFFLCFI